MRDSIDPIRSMRVLLLSGAILLALMGPSAGQRTADQHKQWSKRLEELRAVPYVGFSEGDLEAKKTGVVLYDPQKACQGYNFFYSLESGEAFLFDMEGQQVHKWTYSPEICINNDHAILLENGDLAVIKCQELLRVSWDSETLWRRHLAAHHDVAAAPDGSLYVVTSFGYRNYRGRRVNFDAVLHLNPDGEEIDRWFTYNHLDELRSKLDTRAFLDNVLDSILVGQSFRGGPIGPNKYDYFHLNTVDILPSNPLGELDPRFQQGNVLVCLRNVDQLVILEKDTYRVLWSWGEDELEWPHGSEMLENGHIIVFDNGVRRKYSRVVEVDPLSEAIVWQYTADPPEDFYSGTKGSAQRFPNGNTLICESNKGHVFEVTREGDIVWEWFNPASEQGRLIHIYRMVRVPSAQVERWLNRWRLWLR